MPHRYNLFIRVPGSNHKGFLSIEKDFPELLAIGMTFGVPEGNFVVTRLHQQKVPGRADWKVLALIQFERSTFSDDASRGIAFQTLRDTHGWRRSDEPLDPTRLPDPGWEPIQAPSFWR